MKIRLAAILLLGAAGLVVWFALRLAGHAPGGETIAEPDPAMVAPHEAAAPAVADYKAEWTGLIDAVAVTPPEMLRDQLLALRATWAQRDLTDTADEIERLLVTGDDYETGLPLVVGPNGLLDAWPTFRVFLLDALGVADPNRAVEIARQVIRETKSGDEYAIALRSLARPGPWRADESELLEHFDRMLRNESWWRDQGFAEAFDMARVLGSEAAVSSVLRWPGNPTLRSQALHEFAAEHPAETLSVLQSGSPLPAEDAAKLLARADPGDPAQAETIDAFLRNAADPASAATFLRLFPLRSATTGHRLYGNAPAPFSNESVRKGDLAALALVETWLADPALEPSRAELVKLRDKLIDWTSPEE